MVIPLSSGIAGVDGLNALNTGECRPKRCGTWSALFPDELQG